MAWTAGARTVAALSAEGWFSFEVRNPQAVVVGLTTHDYPSLPIHIGFGARIAGSALDVVEYDVVAASATVTTAPLRVFVGRIGGKLFVSCRPVSDTTTTVALSNGARVPGGAYLFEKNVGGLFGSVYLGASLYGMSDTIYNTELFEGAYGTMETGTVALGPMTADGVEEGVASGTATFAYLRVEGANENSGEGSVSLEPLSAYGVSDGVSTGRVELGPLEATGYGNSFAPTIIGGMVSLGPLTASGSGYGGAFGGTVTMPEFAVIGSQNAYWLGRATLGPLTVAGGGWEEPSVGVSINIQIPAVIGGFAPRDVDADGAAQMIDVLFADSFSMMDEVVYATDAVASNVVAAPLVAVESATTTELIRCGVLLDATETVTAVDEIVGEFGTVVIDTAQAAEETDAVTTTVTDFSDATAALDGVTPGGGDFVDDAGTASDSHTVEWSVTFADAAATASDFIDVDVDLGELTLLSTATTSDTLTANTTASAFMSDEAWAKSALASVVSNAMAWVMNTESSAVSWYTNWPFTEVAQGSTKTYAVGPEGLYVIGANTDNGGVIRAGIELDYTDFGGYDKAGVPQPNANMHRLDTVHVGATHATPLQLTVKTHGGNAYTYRSERGATSTTKNDRFTVGKGLRGRYWKMAIQNTDGGDFSITDISADVANNTRRL